MTENDAGNPARSVRDEDSFDIEKVSVWLRANADPAFSGTVAADPEVRQFPGGASNLTYLHNETYAVFGDAAKYLERRCMEVLS